MRLIFDDYDGIWVWVDDKNSDVELSPRFDEEYDAVEWQKRLKRIFTGK